MPLQLQNKFHSLMCSFILIRMRSNYLKQFHLIQNTDRMSLISLFEIESISTVNLAMFTRNLRSTVGIKLNRSSVEHIKFQIPFAIVFFLKISRQVRSKVKHTYRIPRIVRHTTTASISLVICG